MNKRLGLGCALVLLVGGCAKDRLVGRPDLQIVQNAQLPPPDRNDAIVDQRRTYVVGPSDRLRINVFGLAELTGTVQVDPDGMFTLPLVGPIQAAGKTPVELANIIAASLRARYMRDPQVAVNAETVNQNITVEGQVRTPGLYPVLGRTTLLQALAHAQGLTDDANTSYVVVFRQVNNQKMAALYDVRAIRQGIYADPEVYANDTVTVGESQGRRVFTLAFQTAALLTAPLVAILRP